MTDQPTPQPTHPTHLYVLLDRSGSMSAIRAEVIGGFNDLPACASTAPALTSVATPRFEIGEQSAMMLVDLIEGRTVAQPCIDLGFELKLRQST